MIDISKENSVSLTSFGERLRALRGYASLSRNEIEKRFGIPEATLKSWEFNMQKDVSAKAVRRILQLFHSLGITCSEEWLVFGIGRPPFSGETLDEGMPIKPSILEKVYFEEQNPEAMTFEVADSTLAPYFEPGDVVGGFPIPIRYLAKKLGSFCIFLTYKHERILGRLANGSTDDSFSIIRDLSLKSSTALIHDAKFLRAYEILWTRRPNTLPLASATEQTPL